MEKENSRVELFSDGIFAVVITLLALDIGVDLNAITVRHALEDTTNGELRTQLSSQWPKIVAYFNSFASVLLMWMVHNQLFRLLRTSSTTLVLANGLLLLLIALVPFPTKTLGEFLRTDAQKTAIVFYTGYSVIISMAFVLFMKVVTISKKNLFTAPVSADIIAGVNKGLQRGLLLTMGIFILSLVAPVTALVLHFGTWIFWVLLSKETTAQVK